MLQVRSREIRLILFEGLLIVFSVLFALFIDRWAEDQRIRENKRIALESITRELTDNLEILKKWEILHTGVYQQLADFQQGKNDSLRNRLFREGTFDLGVLTQGRSLVASIPTSTAWESAQATGIITEFDFALVQKLTQAYALQKVLTEKTLSEIVDLYFQPETHHKDKLAETINLMTLRFNELIGQERLIIDNFDQLIRQLENE